MEQDKQGSEKREELFDYAKRQRSKKNSILDGSMNAAGVGFTENFIAAFAIALGSSNMIIALLSTMPKLIGAVIQLFVQDVKSLFRTRKRHIVFFAILQSLMWLPLVLAPQFDHPGGWLLLFVTLNTVFGMLIGPVWNSFIGDVVEENERGRFFGRRNTFTGLIAFISTLCAGWLLSVMKPINPFLGFSILFVLAFIFRLLSAYFLSRMNDPPETDLGTESPDIPAFIMNAEKTPFGRFTIFLMLFYIAVYVSAPFFAVYQLSILGFTYFQFTILACMAAVASFLSMILWGKYVDTIGSKNVLIFCGFMIPLIPLGYALTSSFWLLMVIELFGGAVWAGFNLSISTYIFDATDRRNRTREIAEYTLLIQVAIFLGAMGGSAFLGFFDKSNPAAYVAIFTISAIMRLAVIIFFYRTIQELRIIEIPVKDRLFKKFVSIRPQMGIVYEVAGENLRTAGRMAIELPRQINEEMTEFARKAQGRPKRPVSKIKEMERQEDEQDFQEYRKRLKK